MTEAITNRAMDVGKYRFQIMQASTIWARIGSVIDATTNRVANVALYKFQIMQISTTWGRDGSVIVVIVELGTGVRPSERMFDCSSHSAILYIRGGK